MAIYSLGDLVPHIDETAYVHPDATVIGDVFIGPGSTIWPGAVLRGDFARITIGARTSIQDGAIVHVAAGHPTTVGDNCVIAHLVHLEGCIIGDRCLIGVGALVRHGSVVGSEAIVGAHAMVRDGVEVPARHRALGLPAKIEPAEIDVDNIVRIAELYVENGKRYKRELHRVD